MYFVEPFNELIYQLEILRAKLEIRDHYFESIVKTIYENTGQVLSLVRVQLTTIGSQSDGEIKTRIENSGNLVGQVIHDLRDMCKSFYPENEILSESGLIDALRREFQADLQDNTGNKISSKGFPFALNPETGPIFFLVILEVTLLIRSSGKNKLLQLQIIYTKAKVRICIEYSGEPIDLSPDEEINRKFSAVTKLSVQERLRLINGKLYENRSRKKRRIEISLPYQNA